MDHRSFANALYLYSLGKPQEAKQAALEACEEYDRALEYLGKKGSNDKKVLLSLQNSLKLALAVYDGLKAGKEILNNSTILAHLSSKVGNYIFYPWIEPIYGINEDDIDTDFEDPDGKLALSNLQMNESPEWRRYSEITFPTAVDNDSEESDDKLIGLSQSTLEDCSVVASLLSILAYEERTGRFILRENVYPQENHKITRTAKYVVKLFFNGTPRAVVIDDYLPISSIANNPLFVHNPNIHTPTWPALVEKAYMKVMGGYDFEGSHSASDTYALTGWVPEYILLRDYFEDANTSVDVLWEKLYDNWLKGNLLICVGTGKLTKQETAALGIFGLHDYAVLDLQEIDGEKQLLIRNPWKDDIDGNNNLPTKFWMPLRTVCSRFESLYLNWNVDSYNRGIPIHFLYGTQALKAASVPSLASSFLHNPQYILSNDTKEPVKVVLLLTRHLTGKRIKSDLTDEANDISKSSINPTCYLSMAIYSYNHRIVIPDESKSVIKSPARNMSYCSLQFIIPPKSNYTIVIQCDKGKDVSFAEKFTLNTYTACSKPLSLKKAQDEFPYKAEEQGQWTKFQSGGNWALKNYCDNPQFKLKLGSDNHPNNQRHPNATTKVYLESDSPHPVNIQVLWGRGKYMQIVSDKDVIQSTGKYRTGICGTELKDLDIGEYTIIVSMYEEATLGNFLLHATSNYPVSLTRLMSEKVSLFTRDISLPWNGTNQKQIFASVPRKSRVMVELSLDEDCESTPSSVTSLPSTTPPRKSSYRPHMRLSIFDHYSGMPITNTGDFNGQPQPLIISTSFEGEHLYVIMVERMESGNGQFNLQFHSEVPISITN